MFMCVWYVYMCVHVGMFIHTTFIYTVSLQVRLYLKYELDNVETYAMLHVLWHSSVLYV